jgi:hypothetical protein
VVQLTISFIEAKLKEAEKAVMLYTTLLGELKKATKELEETKQKSKFLNLLITKESEHENN